MIGRIAGRLLLKQPPQIFVDVNGVGYEIDVPMSTLYQLPATGEAVTLFTHLAVREDAHQLFGFATEAERALFRQLIKISGIGARTALSVLSGMSVAELHEAVSTKDGARLTRIPGIGKKPRNACCSNCVTACPRDWSRPGLQQCQPKAATLPMPWVRLATMTRK